MEKLRSRSSDPYPGWSHVKIQRSDEVTGQVSFCIIAPNIALASVLSIYISWFIYVAEVAILYILCTPFPAMCHCTQRKWSLRCLRCFWIISEMPILRDRFVLDLLSDPWTDKKTGLATTRLTMATEESLNSTACDPHSEFLELWNEGNVWYCNVLYGCFRKWWYPQIIHFNRVFHYKPSILGYPYFWKPLYTSITNFMGYCRLLVMIYGPTGIKTSSLKVRKHWWSNKSDAPEVALLFTGRLVRPVACALWL